MGAVVEKNVENTNTFGNYLMHGIEEIILPDAVAWWPSAPGWYVLGFVVFGWLVHMAVRWAQHRWRNRYRRLALRKLTEHGKGNQFEEVVSVLPYYIKVTALQAYPRQDVAGLSGHDWLAFLDKHYAGPAFSGGIGEKLLSVSYKPRAQWNLDEEQSKALIRMSRQWIATHREVQRV